MIQSNDTTMYDEISSIPSKAIKISGNGSRSVESLQFRLRWPYGSISYYLDNVVLKYLKRQYGIIEVLFPAINKDVVKIDYRPELIGQSEIVAILEGHQLVIEAFQTDSNNS